MAAWAGQRAAHDLASWEANRPVPVGRDQPTSTGRKKGGLQKNIHWANLCRKTPVSSVAHPSVRGLPREHSGHKLRNRCHLGKDCGCGQRSPLSAQRRYRLCHVMTAVRKFMTAVIPGRTEVMDSDNSGHDWRSQVLTQRRPRLWAEITAEPSEDTAVTNFRTAVLPEKTAVMCGDYSSHPREDPCHEER